MELSIVVLLLILPLSMAYTPGHRPTTTTDSSNKVLFREIDSITLKRGQFTTGRRSPPLPQLVHIGGSVRKEDVSQHPQEVRCYNRGCMDVNAC